MSALKITSKKRARGNLPGKAGKGAFTLAIEPCSFYK
jgi:hypothetical protein